jgi:hypothetical protein
MSFASVDPTPYETAPLSEFILTSEESEIIEQETAPKQHAYRVALDKYVEDNHLVQLQSDYFGVALYFFSPSQNKMYTVSPICNRYDSPTPIFREINDPHLLSLNNL